MKLKNKKTGDIAYIDIIIDTMTIAYLDGRVVRQKFDCLLDLKDWEDYEEEKDWIDEVKVQELSSGLKIADRDYYEIDADGDKKTEFTWDEAMEIEKKTNGKWRLPTTKELNQMAIDLGYDDDGVFDGKLFAKNLGIEDRFEEDDNYYWSLRSYSTTGSNYLYFSSTSLYPQGNGNRDNEFAVRCVAE